MTDYFEYLMANDIDENEIGHIDNLYKYIRVTKDEIEEHGEIVDIVKEKYGIRVFFEDGHVNLYD